MMMRDIAPSAATASDATTTSGLGSGFSSGPSKISHSSLQLILYCFLPNNCPHTKFHPNRTKKQKLEIFSIGQFWLIGLVGRKMGVQSVLGRYLSFFCQVDILQPSEIPPRCNIPSRRHSCNSSGRNITPGWNLIDYNITTQ